MAVRERQVALRALFPVVAEVASLAELAPVRFAAAAAAAGLLPSTPAAAGYLLHLRCSAAAAAAGAPRLGVLPRTPAAAAPRAPAVVAGCGFPSHPLLVVAVRASAFILFFFFCVLRFGETGEEEKL